METEGRARAGGAFSWNAGTWFGAQIGSTVWLVVLGVAMSLRDDSPPGTAIIALAVAINGIDLLVWEHRSAIRPYPAIQALIAVAGCAALVAFVLIDGTSARPPAGGNGGPPYTVLLVFPAAMAFCALQEHVARRARRTRRRGPHDPLADGPS
jgi:hypothetical protein